MARARRNHLPKITFVAACTPVSSTVAVSSLNLGLPASAQAGDVVLASVISEANQTAGGSYSDTGPAGSDKFVADTDFEFAAPHPGTGSAYAVRLSATDITNGYVTFNFTNFSIGAIRGAVWRGVSENAIDVTPSIAASATAPADPFTFTVPGITTVTGGCTLVALGAVLNAEATAITTPTGYAVADVGNDANALQQFAYKQQATAGATGDVSMTYGPDATYSNEGWLGWLVALRPVSPAITLSATFPASPHVGDTANFDVTATLVDGATGTPTITVDTLPAGLTLGPTSQVDSTHYKATVSGTYTTVQTGTSTYSATGGSVAATPLMHSFNVQAAATTAALVQPVALNNVQASSITGTLASAPTSGNSLIAWLVHNSAATVTPPAGFTQLSYSIGGSGLGLHVWAKTSDGTEKSVTANIDTTRYLGFGYAEWTGSGPHATVTTGGATTAGSSADFGPSSPPVTDAVPFALFGVNGQPSSQSVSSGWTGDFFSSPLAFDVPAAATMNSVPTGSVSGTLSFGNTISGNFSWAIVWMQP